MGVIMTFYGTIINDQGTIQVGRCFLTLRHHFKITEGLCNHFIYIWTGSAIWVTEVFRIKNRISCLQ